MQVAASQFGDIKSLPEQSSLTLGAWAAASACDRHEMRTKSRCRLSADPHFEFRRVLDREIGRLCTAENLIDDGHPTLTCFRKINRTVEQATGLKENDVQASRLKLCFACSTIGRHHSLRLKVLVPSGCRVIAQ